MTRKKQIFDNETFLTAVAEEAAFTGFTDDTVHQVLTDQNITMAEYHAHFPEGLNDIADAFSTFIDDQMLTHLSEDSITPIRIRDKIAYAVDVRLGISAPYKDMIRGCAKYWGRKSPDKAVGAIWQTADKIWNWAGDDATDYNRYTKRGLLSGVILSTTIFWLNDDSHNHEASTAFLKRRIDNVLTFGKIIGKPMKTVMRFFNAKKDKTTSAPHSRNEDQT